MKLRPMVRIFAEAMEAKLRKHDAAKGDTFRHLTMETVLKRLREEVDELEGTFPFEQERTLDEAVDVANFAMFSALHEIEKRMKV